MTPAELLESLKLLLLGCTSPLFEPDLRPSEADPHHISVHSACVDVDIASQSPGRLQDAAASPQAPRQLRPVPGLRVSGLDSGCLEAFLQPYLRHFVLVSNVLQLCQRSSNETSLQAKGLVYQVDSIIFSGGKRVSSCKSKHCLKSRKGCKSFNLFNDHLFVVILNLQSNQLLC